MYCYDLGEESVFFSAVLVRFLLGPLVHIYDIVLLGTFLYAGEHPSRRLRFVLSTGHTGM